MVWPGAADRTVLVVDHQRVTVHVPPGEATSGLLGNNNGVADDDLRYPNGALVADPASEVTGPYAEAWRITDTESAFTYPAGQSTATFTDRTYPKNQTPPLAGYSDADVSAATQACQDGGVSSGPQAYWCTVDYLNARDASFIEAAGSSTAVLRSVNDATFGPDNALGTGFEGALPPNLAPLRLTSDPTLSSYAGPMFSRDRYGFYGDTHTPHDATRVSFDLIELGDWASAPGGESVHLSLNGTDVWSTSFTRAADGTAVPTAGEVGPVKASGTTAAGQPYRVVPVSVNVPSTDSRSSLSLSSTGLSAASNNALGVDNVSVALHAVPPQSFDVGAAPFTASDGAPGPGAGNLETKASQDVYRFTVPARGQSVYVGWSGSPNDSRLANWQIVDDTTGAQITSSFYASDKQVDNLPAGTYRLEVNPFNGQTGTYGLQVFPVPAPQSFDVGALPFSDTDGAPGPGAGNLETKASKDVYRFTVPAGGQPVYVAWSGSPNNSGLANWRVVDDTTGAQVTSSLLASDQQIGNLPAGAYRLEVNPFNGQIGTYGVQVFPVPAPQSFDLGALPFAASDGVPGPGAGDLETKASQDVYRFTVPAGGRSVDVTWPSSPNNSGVANWQIVDDTTGAQVTSSIYTFEKQVTNLPAGPYRLQVMPFNGQIGPYRLQVAVVPGADGFDVGPAPFTVSNGAPGPGAGNLEATSSKDVYRFTVPAGGQSIYVGWSGSPNNSGLANWQIVNDTTGAQITSSIYASDKQVDNLPAGTYRLEVSPFTGQTGPYGLQVFPVPAPQTFAVGAASFTVTNGAPAAGAGNLETKASKDIYTFTVPAGGQSIYVGWSGSPNNSGLANWQIVNDTTGARITSSIYASDKQVDNLPAGTYRLEVSPFTGQTGPYGLQVFPVPAPQTFAVGAASFTVTNGAPAAGAGNLETKASKDIYTFTVPAGGQSIYVGWSGSPNNSGLANWQIVNDTTGAQITSSIYASDKQVDNLPAGTYRLEVSPFTGQTGPYAFQVRPV